MRKTLLTLLIVALAAGPAWAQASPEAPRPAPAEKATTRPAEKDYWVAPMKLVHAKFKGEKGTFAHFGDSITVTMAFWASLKWSQKNMDKPTQAAFDLVKGYMKDDCWTKWKGDEYGNTGMMVMKWCADNVDKWLKKLNPECVLIMFGTNDLGGVSVADYEKYTRQAVQKCLDNGSVVILSTIPPRHGADAKVKQFVEVVYKVAQDLKVPVCDYYQAVMDRRPEDWSGALEKFKDPARKDEYQVPTLISADGVHPSNPQQWVGDYSAEGLKHNGYVLRNYVVLHSYAEVISKVFQPKPAAGAAPAGAAK